jgi:hypothetical protein
MCEAGMQGMQSFDWGLGHSPGLPLSFAAAGGDAHEVGRTTSL